MSRPLLIASVDQLVLLRASRKAREPDPVHFAMEAELAGVQGIRAHLRQDRRLLSEEDADLLSRQVKSRFYLQMAPHAESLHLVNALRPRNLILSAERREGRTSEIGLDVALIASELQGMLHNIDNSQTKVFFLIEPDLSQVKVAAKLGISGLVINVKDLMVDPHLAIDPVRYKQVCDAVRLCTKYHMEAHVAGGILPERLPDLLKIENLHAIHIGHHLVSRACLTGVREAVRDILSAFART